MFNSMTGYGRAQQTVDGKDILVEIKAVNHRYLNAPHGCRVHMAIWKKSSKVF